MEYRNQFQPTVVTDAQTLPTWVRWLFRFYAVYALFLVAASSFHLINSLIIKNHNLMNDPTLSFGNHETLTLATEVILSLVVHGTLLTLLLVFFIIAILRLRKWVLPLVLLFSLHTVIVTTLSIFPGQLSGVMVALFALLNLGVAMVIGYAAVRYWSGFAGSARRLLVQIPLLFFLLPHLLFPVLFALFPDDATINDQDLVLEPVALLTPEDNAHYALPDMSDLSEDTQEYINTTRQLTREDNGIDVADPLVQSIVEETRELTDAFMLAAKRTGYQCPTSVNNYGYDTVFCNLAGKRDLAILTSLRAQVEAETSGIDEGLLTAASVVQFGVHFTHAEQPTFIERLVGIAVQGIGISAIEQILQTEEVPSTTTIQVITATLKQAEVSETGAINALRYEYMFLRQVGRELAQYSNYFYQQNKTVNMFAQSTRYSVAAVQKGCGADIQEESEAIEALIDDAVSAVNNLSIWRPNSVGNILFATAAPNLVNIGEGACELNERNRELQRKLQTRLSFEISQD